MSRFKPALVAALVLSVPMSMSAQTLAGMPSMTIGNYSDAQRAAMEADMRRVAARALVPAMADVVVPAPTSMVAAIPLATTSLVAAHLKPAPEPETRIAVTGVAQMHGKWFAEVVTDASGAQWLTTGSVVPRAPWRVQSIDTYQVVFTSLETVRKSKPMVRTIRLSGAGAP